VKQTHQSIGPIARKHNTNIELLQSHWHCIEDHHEQWLFGSPSGIRRE
jgi:hypothetical protein